MSISGGEAAERLEKHAPGFAFPEEPSTESWRSYFTPLRLVLIIAVSVFAIEAVVMLAISFAPSLSAYYLMLIDAAALTFLTLPLFYYFLYRPMALHISERKKVETALRDSEERHRSLLELMSDVFWEVDGECRYTGLTSGAGDVFGYTPEELKGRSVFDLAPKDEAGAFREKCRAMMSAALPIRDFEHRIVRKNGTIAHLLVNAVPKLGLDGSFQGYRGVTRDITDRKRGEEALRVSEMKYRIIADNTSNWEFWISPRGYFLYSSPSCERITGYAAEEFEENPHLLARITHPDDQMIFAEHESSPMESRGDDEIEFRVIHRDGSKRVIVHQCRPIYDSDGQFLGVRGSNRDVTEKRRIAGQLKESERRFREIVENVRLATVILDLNGNIFYMNDHFLSMAGFERGALIGGDFFEKLVIPGKRDELRNLLYSNIERGETPAHHIGHILTSGGDELVISWNNTILREGGGRVVGITSIGEDITSRVRAEEALRRAHDELELRVKERTAEIAALIEQSPVAIAVFDMKGRLVEGNRAFNDIFGYPRADGADEDYNIFDDEFLQREGIIHGARRVFSEGGMSVTKPVFIGPRGLAESSGDGKWVVMRFSAVVDESGSPIRMLTMIEDVTEIKAAEEAFHLLVEGTASFTGEDFFRPLVRNLASAIKASHVYVTEKMGEDGRARSIAFWMKDRFADPFEFDLKGTPCAEVYERRAICFYPDGIQELFPEDKELRDMALESYMGAPLLSSSGEVIGHIGVLDEKPMKDRERKESILRVFAARAGAELERKQAEEAMIKSHETMVTVLDSLDAGVYVADIKSYEVLFVNKYVRDIFGDAVGKTCWMALQAGQQGPCPFCTNKRLLTEDGSPAGVYVWEFQNTLNKRWYEVHDRAIHWIDGRVARIEIAMDITERKRMEEAFSQLRAVT